MQVVRYSLDKKSCWDAFVSDAKNSHFMFYRDYMEYHSDRFKDFSLMFYDEKGKIVAIFPANVSDNILYSHQGLSFGGFVIDRNMKQKKMLGCFDSLKSFSVENGFSKIIYKSLPIIYHQIPAQEDLYALFINQANLTRLDSSSCLDLGETFKLPKGRKASISKARREGVYVEESTDFDAFIELENNVLQEHHGTRAVHTGAELVYLKNKFPENIKLYVAKTSDEDLVAGALVFIWKKIVHTQYLANNDLGRGLGALDLLISELINKCKLEKFRYLNFGISNEENGRYLNEGLISQKESFGARTIVFNHYEIREC